MNKLDDIALELYKRPETVFTFKDIALLYPSLSRSTLKNKLHYAIKTGKIISLRKGVYAKEGFSFYEAANKIYTPSYVSLETVLAKAGIIFQNYKTIFAISYLTRKLKIKRINIYYRKLKDEILHNKSGIEIVDNYSKAIPERAFLDAVFLYQDYHFDNLNSLDWQKVEKLKSIYKSQALEKRVRSYYKILRGQ